MSINDGGDTPSDQPGPRFGATLVVVLLVLALPIAMTTPGAAQRSAALPADPAFVLVLEPDGSARATITVVFDLATDTDERAFEALRANATAREHRIDRFASRMGTITDRAESTTGREMGITDPSIEFIERDDTGIVALSVTWTGLAARSDDSLVVDEPFASGFTADRAVYMYGPEGYTIKSASPTPTEQGAVMAKWAGDTSLDGFAVTFVPADNTPEGATADAPGFTLGLALLALLIAVALALTRIRRR